MPLVIKRYPNRKLYNTQAKRYISLNELTHLVREGVELQVLDYASGEDITTVILAQIIQEQEKKQKGFFPVSFLASLVQAQGDIVQIWRRFFTSTVELEYFITSEIERRVSILVEEDELTPQEGTRITQKMSGFGIEKSQPAQWFDRWILQYFEKYGLASRTEYERLAARLEELNCKLENLEAEAGKS